MNGASAQYSVVESHRNVPVPLRDCGWACACSQSAVAPRNDLIVREAYGPGLIQIRIYDVGADR